MLSIEPITFQPLPDDFPEFKVEIWPPSAAQKIEFSVFHLENLKEKIADEKLSPKEEAEELKKNNDKTNYVLKALVKKVEGISLFGTSIENIEDLIAMAPDKVMEPIVRKVVEVMGMDPELKKKS